jgi:hypothetical protein
MAKKTREILIAVVKLPRGKGFEDFNGFDIRRDETPLNAKPYPLGKCPKMGIFGHFPCEK